MATLTLTTAGQSRLAASSAQSPVEYTQITLGSGTDSGNHAARTALVAPISGAVYPFGPPRQKYTFEAQQGTTSRQFVAVDVSTDAYPAIQEVGVWAGNTLVFYGDLDAPEDKAADEPMRVIVDTSYETAANAVISYTTGTIQQGTASASGIWRAATQAEFNARTAADRVVTPSVVPLGTDAVAGLWQGANQTEVNARAAADRVVTPSVLPLGSTLVAGLWEAATGAEGAAAAANRVITGAGLYQTFDALPLAGDANVAEDSTIILHGENDRWNRTALSSLASVIGGSDTCAFEYDTPGAHTYTPPDSDLTSAIVLFKGAAGGNGGISRQTVSRAAAGENGQGGEFVSRKFENLSSSSPLNIIVGGGGGNGGDAQLSPNRPGTGGAAGSQRGGARGFDGLVVNGVVQGGGGGAGGNTSVQQGSGTRYDAFGGDGGRAEITIRRTGGINSTRTSRSRTNGDDGWCIVIPCV